MLYLAVSPQVVQQKQKPLLRCASRRVLRREGEHHADGQGAEDEAEREPHARAEQPITPPRGRIAVAVEHCAALEPERVVRIVAAFAEADSRGRLVGGRRRDDAGGVRPARIEEPDARGRRDRK